MTMKIKKREDREMLQGFKSAYWRYGLLMMCLSLVGCGTHHQNQPEIGSGTNDLKASSCENCNLKPFYRNGQWLIGR